MADQRIVRCAICTRKSSEEGLDQTFNSLDAQREACEAYIISQKHEGWRGVKNRYDDGGYSGGNMDRPALKRLLEDIEASRVDTVVVYKVDRLTRSLADFAKIIERFDGHSVSFVSVTQQFNTTSSMGRLTLNVLLSFAQFEREVTGERIRDKIAASKRKGMWMGGYVPMGYNLKNRKLLVNDSEARTIREIFRVYLETRCVSKLQRELENRGIRSKVRSNKSGGGFYSRGALYKILQNRLYLGKIAHRGQVHDGQHEPIVDSKLWAQVQSLLASNNRAGIGLRIRPGSLLTGIIFDEEGRRLTPTHSLKKGKRFRYYSRRNRDVKPFNLPASLAEEVVVRRLVDFLASQRVAKRFGEKSAACSQRIQAGDAASVAALVSSSVSRVVVKQDSVEIELNWARVTHFLRGTKEPARPVGHTIKLKAPLAGKLAFSSGPSNVPNRLSASLVKAVCRAHVWVDDLMNRRVADQKSIAARLGVHVRYVGRIMELAFLAPPLVELILEGRQPQSLTLDRIRVGMSYRWDEQQSLF